MIKRRKFIKRATIGTLSITSFGGLSNLNQAYSNTVVDKSNVSFEDKNSFFPDSSWNIDFNSKNSILTLHSHSVIVTGNLRFSSNGNEWSLDGSRDGVKDRYTLIDPAGDVQGYWLLNQCGTRLELLFYHRTAQRFKGEFSYEGSIHFLEDAFPCRTKPADNETVLQLASGEADSLLNDSLFSPQNDFLLQLSAIDTVISYNDNGVFDFQIMGNIDQAPEATFVFLLENHYFKNRYVPYYSPIDRDRCPVAPTGWMSWNTYFDTATAQDNLDEAKIGKKYLQPFGCEFWSIESWQGNSDTLPVCDFYNIDLEVNEKQFPKGMKNLADEIRELGFRPGLWTAPFGTGNDVFYQKHKKWFLHDKEDKPISSWNGKYTLDPTVKEVREHLKKIHNIASQEWGYEFFKIDGMSGRNHSYSAHLYERPEIKERFSDPTCSNPFKLCIESLREGIGEDRVYLACQGHTSGPEALYADASRIGADIVNPNEPVKWSGVYNQASCFLNQAFTHNIVMYADPDTLLVRDLPLEEARTSATIVALPGQLTFFGDKLAGLSDEKMKILQQTLPVADAHPVNLYPYFSMLPIWNLAVNHDHLGPYNVVAFFNWEDEAKTVTTTTKELGISDTEYIGLEFWEGQPFHYKTLDKELSMIVPPRGVRVVTLHTVTDTPQWIGSDRHISQNGMEITNMDWDNTRKQLKGTVQVIETFPVTMHIRIPDKYTFKGIKCKYVKYSVSKGLDIVSITLTGKKTDNIDFAVEFIV